MDIKDIAKKIRKDLKQAYPEHKFSVTIDRFSGGQSLDVSLMAGKDNPFDGDKTHADNWKGESYHQGDHAQLNQYYITKLDNDKWVSNGILLTSSAAKMLIQVVKIANKRNWNHSDVQSDYFNVNYYFGIQIGKWNKPYKILED